MGRFKVKTPTQKPKERRKRDRDVELRTSWTRILKLLKYQEDKQEVVLRLLVKERVAKCQVMVITWRAVPNASFYMEL